MSITYDYYRTFYIVAQYGSFSKAAAVLMNGQPNVTKTINNLESQLGCKLFLRSNRGVSLTPEGEKLYAHAAVAFEHLSSAENELTSLRTLSDGFLSIATTENALYGSVLDALSRFRHNYPNVRIKLTNLSSPQALEALKNGLAELCVVTGEPEGDFRYTSIRQFRELLCCKKGLLDSAALTGIDALLHHPFVSLDKSTATYAFYRDYLLSCGIQKEPDIEVATAQQILPIVESGIGIGFISEFIAKESLESGKLEEIALNCSPRRTIYLVEHKKRGLSIVARTFSEYLLAI